MNFIGIEISPEYTRAVVLDLDAATIRAEATAPHAWLEDLPAGYHEQNPAQWIDTVDRTVRQCLESLTPEEKSRVAGIGVAGPRRGMVLLDADNRIVRPAKLAGDTSVRKQAADISRAFGGAPGLTELLGQVPGNDSAAAECLWLRQHEPYHFERAECLLTVQDFITYWLTGVRSCEASSASTTGLFDVRRREWRAEMTDFIAPELARLLPPPGPANQPRGPLRPALATAWGIPDTCQVAPGGPAPMLSALASGCVTHGAVAIDISASGMVIASAARPVVDLRGELHTFCGVCDDWLVLAATANAALAPGAIRRHYGWSASQFAEMVAGAPPGADGLTMLPYFNGETLPRLPDASGLLLGITAENLTPAHLARATVEGVALGLGYAISRLLDLGFEPSEARLVGSENTPDIFHGILADVIGIPVTPLASRHGAAVGAAMQAAVAFFQQTGEPLGFTEIAGYFVAGDVSARRLPDPANHRLYQEMISRQQYLVDTLHPAGFL